MQLTIFLVWQYCYIIMLGKPVLWKKDLWKRMKLDLAVKMIPVVVVFWWVFFLMNRPVSFCIFWLLLKLFFPKHVTELSLHLQAQHCSYNFFCCQTKDNLYLAIAVLLPKQRNPLRKQTKPNKIIRLALLQTKQKGLLCPWFLLYPDEDDTGLS